MKPNILQFPTFVVKIRKVLSWISCLQKCNFLNNTDTILTRIWIPKSQNYRENGWEKFFLRKPTIKRLDRPIAQNISEINCWRCVQIGAINQIFAKKKVMYKKWVVDEMDYARIQFRKIPDFTKNIDWCQVIRTLTN